MSGGIVAFKDYVAGWLDSTVRDFLKVLPPDSESTRYALITRLDSNPDVASLRRTSPELKSVAPRAKVLGNGLLLPTRLLLADEVRAALFFGFDEVWFFPDADVAPKPASGSLVGPARITEARLERLGRWMSDNGCALGLGDGEGLNFVVKARGLVKYLLGSSIGQAELSTTVA